LVVVMQTISLHQ